MGHRSVDDGLLAAPLVICQIGVTWTNDCLRTQAFVCSARGSAAKVLQQLFAVNALKWFGGQLTLPDHFSDFGCQRTPDDLPEFTDPDLGRVQFQGGPHRRIKHGPGLGGLANEVDLVA